MRARFLLAFLLATPSFAAQEELFDDTVLRALSLTFHQPDWWSQLGATVTSGEYVAADLEVDGDTYLDVGVRVRGRSTLFCANGEKLPFKISMDAFVPGQKLYGYDVFRLNNGAGDPTFLREALMSKALSGYMPAAKRAFVRLELNGEYWGLYINEQQKDKTYLEEWFGADTGNRYRNAGGALEYFPNAGAYKIRYSLKSPVKADSWLDLMELCDRLNNTPIGPDLLDALLPVLDVEKVLWTCAAYNLFGNLDGYYNANNYYMLQDDAQRRFHFQLHDLDLSFGTYKSPSTSFSLTQGFGKDNRPLTYRLFQHKKTREEFYAHIETMARETFDWDVIGPLAWQYHQLIDAAVQADTKKMYSYQDFLDGITQDVTANGNCFTFFPGLQRWVEERQAFVLAHSKTNRPQVEFGTVWHTPFAPTPGADVVVTAEVVGAEPASKVQLRYGLNGGVFTRVTMKDDGLSGDGAAGDGVFGVKVPGAGPAGKPGMRVEYVVVGTGASDGTKSFWPTRGESTPLHWSVAFGTAGLRVTEYLYSGTDGEFVELTNTSTAPIDLSGWSLDDQSANAGAFDLSSAGTLQPGEAIVVTDADAVAFAAAWNLSGVTVLGGNDVAPLARNDAIHVFDGSGEAQDRLVYGDEQFPGTERAKGESAWACELALGFDDPYRWRRSASGDDQGSGSSAGGDVGSPGRFVPAACPDLGEDYCSSAANSTGQSAQLVAAGSPALAQNALELTVSSVPQNQFGYFLLSSSWANVPAFGGSQGVLCLGSPIVRFADDLLSSGATSQMSFRPDLTHLPQGTAIQSGETWSWQLWYRDVNPGPTSNTSNGLAIAFF